MRSKTGFYNSEQSLRKVSSHLKYRVFVQWEEILYFLTHASVKNDSKQAKGNTVKDAESVDSSIKKYL
jgi:hypothetical protein